MSCDMCGALGAYERGFQVGGREDEARFLPDAAEALKVVRVLKEGSRQHEVRRCRACGAWFEYRTDYEFLVGGSEDEQVLERIDEARARALLSPERSVR